MAGVDKHHARYVRRELGRENSNVLSPNRVANQYIRARDGSALEQLVQIVHDGCSAAGACEGSLHPSPARSYQQTVVNLATCDWTILQP
ncbi:MAG TPA: hypothetical protein VE779_16910 [Candidatus Angelobacter sp.]|nr:hypothetical protein [Candidatus Angelobacter sp.]